MCADHIRIYLDDIRDCPNGWKVARNVVEAIDIINKHKGTFDVSLDHDLGPDEWNGTTLVKWFINTERYPNIAYIHTANPVGRKNIEFDLAIMRREQFNG